MDNQPPSPASTPVNPSGTAYVPPVHPPPPLSSNQIPNSGENPSQPPTNPTPPTPPSPVTPPLAQTPLGGTTPPNPRSKMLLMIMGLLVVGILAGGGYFYYMNMQKLEQEMKPINTVKILPTMIPTATPMATDSATASVSADWKTYVNTQEGFSIQYPKDWIIAEEHESPSTGTDFSMTFSNVSTKSAEKHASMSIAVVDTKDEQDTLQNWGDMYDSKVFTSNGKSYIIIASTEQIGGTASKEIEQLAREMFAQMVPTFKFTQ